MDISRLHTDILGSLIDSPESVAGLYGILNFEEDDPYPVTVAELKFVLDAMENLDWVQAYQVEDSKNRRASTWDKELAYAAYEGWLPDIKTSLGVYDEIGLWYQVTDVGKTEFHRLVGDKSAGNQWKVDEFTDTHSIEICASSLDLAEEQLASWVVRRANIEIVTKAVESNYTFALRDGKQVLSGVRLLCTFKPKD